MSDARWLEIDAAVASAIHHFAGAAEIFDRFPTASGTERYLVEMAFMHAMQAAHTSLENALLRILELCGEEAPTGRQWHADLIRRAARDVDGRPAILVGEVAEAADETRQFRNVAARSYDNFNERKAAPAVAASRLLAHALPKAIARFRQAIDP
ncbi:MAG: hypothetical protein BGO51_09880 [Rhodospirillales bacterium 69-11]|jgi:hypothetical protein|nr:hypothetical protein [Rhodospirillales bacterium]OJW20106.1 MAG: hypothetical protein BGO51_09880 [Rhodospirillales bacterium 69-11]